MTDIPTPQQMALKTSAYVLDANIRVDVTVHPLVDGDFTLTVDLTTTPGGAMLQQLKSVTTDATYDGLNVSLRLAGYSIVLEA